MTNLESDRWPQRLLAAAVVMGLVLRAWQYLWLPPLWLDELALVNGALSGPASRLFTGALDFGQVAPSGFLLVEWIAQRIAPASELGLRAMPFLFACGTVVAVALIAREVIGSRDAWIAVSIVALSGPLITMGATVKPYAGDAFLTTLIVLLAIHEDRSGTRGSRIRLGVAGTLIPWLSFSAAIATAGVAVLLGWRRVVRGDAASRKVALLILAPWLLSAIPSLVIASRLVSPYTQEWMDRAWSAGYPVIPPRTIDDLLWPLRTIQDITWDLVAQRPARVFTLGVIGGLLVLWFRRPQHGRLVVVPLLAALGAAYAQAYPLRGRVAHSMAPIVALAVTALVPVLAGLVRQRAAAASLLLGAGLVASPVRTLLTAPPPFFRDDVRPIMTYLKSNAREGEPLYVYWGAWHAWQVYGRLSPSMELIMGGCPRDYPRGHLHELDSMRGSPRAWILFTRVYDLPTQHLMLSYLDAIGVRQDSLSQTPPDGDRSSAVTLFSYDLSDTTRLSAASAASFPVPNADRRENCFGPDVIWRRADGSRAVTLF